MRLVTTFFGKRSALCRKSAINLVGRDMIKAMLLVLALPRFTRALQKGKSSEYVRLYKLKGRLNRPIYMALCCEMNDPVWLIRLKEPADSFQIANIHVFKKIIRLRRYSAKVIQIARIGQLINVYYPIGRVF